MLYTHGHVQTVSKVGAGTANATVNCKGFTSLMIIHDRTSATGSAFGTCVVQWAEGAAGVVHDAPSGNSDWGLNVKTAVHTTDGAVSIFRGVSPFVLARLRVASGSHTLYAVPIRL